VAVDQHIEVRVEADGQVVGAARVDDAPGGAGAGEEAEVLAEVRVP